MPSDSAMPSDSLVPGESVVPGDSARHAADMGPAPHTLRDSAGNTRQNRTPYSLIDPPTPTDSAIALFAPAGIGEVTPGADLVVLIADAVSADGHGPLRPGDIIAEIERYMAWPGQARHRPQPATTNRAHQPATNTKRGRSCSANSDLMTKGARLRSTHKPLP